ncbi:hypothetical protein P3X46_015951 [Hevea brasiliensis]|uniref:Uncharacterized protein n=1 Tax=Hevea brasiliensis TaxID=3981 RepID=A0ABQ9LXI5_HEVBR|nr:hypothetical protein P3X46_015951 [Hevea brasiliensis]
MGLVINILNWASLEIPSLRVNPNILISCPIRLTFYRSNHIPCTFTIASSEHVPSPLATPTVTIQETETSSRGKAKMTNYLKLDAPKYKEGDDPFDYVKSVKMIADELDASDSRAIQMASFTLKCEKAKEWHKSYVVDKVDKMT